MIRRHGLRFAAIGVLLAVALTGSVMLGSVRIPFGEVLRVLAGGEASRPAWTVIIRSFRLPRAATAALAGAGLGVSGLLMQTMFRNPLAGPFVLGISSGAGLGVALFVLASGTALAGGFLSVSGLFSGIGLAGAATLGAAVVLVAVIGVARRLESVTLLLLLGVLFGYAAGALTTVLVHFSDADRVQAYVRWTFGSVANVGSADIVLLAGFVVVGIAVAVRPGHALNVMLTGDEYAASVGVRVTRVRGLAVAASALLSGSVTAFCGPIGFVGVAVPHLARGLFLSSDHRVLLPATVLLGASVTVIADLIAQLPGSEQTLPLNAVTALFGAPIVAWVLIRRRSSGETA